MNYQLARANAQDVAPSTFTLPDGEPLTTADIVVDVEIRGVYDGTCCWLLTDGRIINRMSIFGGRREHAVDDWIAVHGDALRQEFVQQLRCPRCGSAGIALMWHEESLGIVCVECRYGT